MRNTFNILFYIKKNALKSNGKAPVMVRITMNKEVKQFSAKCDVNPEDWNSQAGKAVGKTAEIQNLNKYLDNIKATLIRHYREISDRESSVTAEKVRNAFFGISTRSNTLLDLFDKHIETLKNQIGINVSKDTHQKYIRTRTRLEEFMKEKYNISDISLKEINYSFLCDFEVYLKTIHNCGQNTTAKFMQRFKTILIIAKNNGWIYADPFSNYKLHFEKTEREYLNQQEIEKIMNKKFIVKRLEIVRDIFIFSYITDVALIRN